MPQVKYNSPGVTANDAGIIPRLNRNVVSNPATVIGTSPKGPAFVPMGFSKVQEFQDMFGIPYVSGSRVSSYERLTDYGPLAVQTHISNGGSATFMRVLGSGNCKKRVETGSTSGDVVNSGFTVGEEQPDQENFSGSINKNPYANAGGPLGRTYFLGCFMSESVGSNIFNSAGLQGTGSVNGIGLNTAVPIVRGILMAPSGVILRLSSSVAGYDSSQPSSTQIASDSSAKGTTLGAIKLFDENSGNQLQQFIVLLNGHKGSEDYPNVITASLDMQSPLYITRVLNTTASLAQKAGHYLASHWDIHPAVATLTGVGVISAGAGAASNSSRVFSTERSVFLLTSSLQRDVGSLTVPNYEGFRDRFSYASTPWIISQKIHGKYINLFKLHSLDAGYQREKYKIIIHDISLIEDESKFGTFSLTIRRMHDFDETDSPLETFINLSLDPKSDRYIAKVIGDSNTYFDFDRPDDSQKLVFEGNYPNNSKYIRVEMSNDVSNDKIPYDTIPMGFRGIPHIVTSGSSVMASLGGQDSTALLDSTFLKNLVTYPLPLADNISVFNGDVQNASNVRRWGIKFDHIVNQQKQNNFKHINKSIDSFTKHYPNHSTINVNFSVADNQGVQDTTQLGILDADRFCNNVFTLENVKIVTGSTGYSPNENWKYARYVRNGIITVDDVEKTRRVNITDFTDPPSRNFLSFQTTLCGGFDGTNVFDSNEFNLTNLAVVADMNDPTRGKSSAATTAAYLKSLEILADTSAVDMQVLAIPGIRAPVITDEAADVAERRMDSLYVMDIEQIDDNDEQIEISKTIAYSNRLIPNLQKTIDNFESRAINTSYAAAYYPDVSLRIDAPTYGFGSIEVPPSVAVLGGLAVNDLFGQPWLSPAGNIRGSLPNVDSTIVKLKKSDVDFLYKKNINFLYAPSNVAGTIINGIGSGVVIGGQKTLNKSMSSLSRISTRRLLINIRKRVRNISLRLLFEQDRTIISDRFTQEASEALDSIKASGGIENYRIEFETASTNDIDNQTVRGKIYIKPPKSIDYLSLDFIVSNNLQSEI